jgi:exopolyphosphatase/guanosine-5'-triphosphate,3'-diphosphate pyrophosphatase
MEGFKPEELDIIGNIARYHRGSLLNKKHSTLANITKKEDLKLIKVLSSFLRIADGLDRTHTDAISNIKCIIEKDIGNCTFIIYPKSISCTQEILAANKKKDLFEETFDISAIFAIQHA